MGSASVEPLCPALLPRHYPARENGTGIFWLLLQAISTLKHSSGKGTTVQSCTISGTSGPCTAGRNLYPSRKPVPHAILHLSLSPLLVVELFIGDHWNN